VQPKLLQRVMAAALPGVPHFNVAVKIYLPSIDDQSCTEIEILAIQEKSLVKAMDGTIGT
jgi:hypothetical protein